jgi:hypothetical protein
LPPAVLLELFEQADDLICREMTRAIPLPKERPEARQFFG